MMGAWDIVAVLMISAGAFFLLIASIGIVRLSDYYSRVHAMGSGDTLGIILILLGLCVYEGFTLISAKLLVALVFVGLTNPVASHALARAALRYGLKPILKKDQPENSKSSKKANALEA